MKTVLSILALCFTLTTSTFAQFGQAQCAWNAQAVTEAEKNKTVHFSDIEVLGITNSEGDNAYSVALTINFATLKASQVVVTETGTGKKWVMNQESTLNGPSPIKCNSGQGLPWGTMVFKGNATSLVVYVNVPQNPGLWSVYVYKPATTQFKANL
ncbi:hypothetical protein GCM10027592_61580 [Spirosoma flavus]